MGVSYAVWGCGGVPCSVGLWGVLCSVGLWGCPIQCGVVLCSVGLWGCPIQCGVVGVSYAVWGCMQCGVVGVSYAVWGCGGVLCSVGLWGCPMQCGVVGMSYAVLMVTFSVSLSHSTHLPHPHNQSILLHPSMFQASSPSALLPCTMAPGPADAPADLEVSNRTASSAQLRWQVSSGFIITLTS